MFKYNNELSIAPKIEGVASLALVKGLACWVKEVGYITIGSIPLPRDVFLR